VAAGGTKRDIIRSPDSKGGLMRQRLRHIPAAVCCAIFTLTLAALSIDLRGQAAKRPLTYDVFDAWKSIQGTTLSRDGQWLAYGITAQALDIKASSSSAR
jgi:hypothetical protein